VHKHPIKANPAKAGDAKPWVYRHQSDHDRQAAEDHKLYLCGLAWLITKPGFLSGWPIHHPIRAAPSKYGSAKQEKAMSRTLKIMFVVFAILIVSVAAYAFAAANTVPATKAGSGAGVISGYTVSNIVYNLNLADPTVLDSVDFTLSAAAGTVKIKLVAAGSTWYDCSVVTGNNFTCDTTATSLSLSTIDELTVVATE
jgi:hypothetical protein